MPYDVAVVGAGYVGLPLSTTFAEAGCRVLLVDVVAGVVDALNRGESHIEGTTDIISSAQQQRLLHKASDYVKQYNILLLRYLREHPKT